METGHLPMVIMKCETNAFPFSPENERVSGLTEKVMLAGPDVVADYKNEASAYDAEGWVKQTALDADSIIGLYDVHAYPGQNEVRTGQYPEILSRYKRHVPEGKRLFWVRPVISIGVMLILC